MKNHFSTFLAGVAGLLLAVMTTSVHAQNQVQNFLSEIDGIIQVGVGATGNITFKEDSVSITNGEITYILDDPPGVASPSHSDDARQIPGGEPGDLYPNFGGIQAYSNDRGSFRVHLASGGGHGQGVQVVNQIYLNWQGDYVRSAEADPFRFIINPGLLRLVDSRPFGSRNLSAFWLLEATARRKSDGEILSSFQAIRKLVGSGAASYKDNRSTALDAFENNYQMEIVDGPIPGQLTPIMDEVHVDQITLYDPDTGDVREVIPAHVLYTLIGAQYKTPGDEGTLDVSALAPGEVFTVTYQIIAITVAFGADGVAECQIGDPLKYKGGIMTDYDDYGEILRITGISIDEQGHTHVRYKSDPDYYYILCSGEDVKGIKAQLTMKLGEAGVGELIDERSTGARPNTFYQVKRVHRTVPLDSDNDNIDDYYELLRPAILDPFDPADVFADSDGDGRNARQEYLEGTDPEVDDEGPNSNSNDLYPGANFPYGGGTDLETADVNNDGVADLVAGGGGALYVTMGNLDGSFAPPSLVTIPGAGPFGDIVLTRLNADDFPDVVFADQVNNRVVILFGDGLGGFAFNAEFALGVAPYRAVLAHVNNDAHLDIVTINNRAFSVSVLLGNGDGTFQAPTTLATQTRPTDAVAVLLNDDAHPDLVVTLETGGSFAAVFLNNGDGTFAPKVSYPTGASPQRVATADVNGDTFADIVTSNQTGDGISVLLGNGDGTLGAKADYPTGDNPRGFLVTDLDGDTDLDVLVAHVGANFHAKLLNDGTGNFTAGDPAFTSSDNFNCLLVDVDRDGNRDIVGRLNTGVDAMVSRGLSGGAFDTREQYSYAVGQFSPRDFEVADVNGDGRLDVLVSNQRSNTVDILAGQAGGGFSALTPIPIGEKVEGFALASLDAGPTLDLAVVTQRPDFSPGNSSNKLYVLHGSGAGTFTLKQELDLNGQPNDVLPGDFDGNGRRDLVVAFNPTGELQLFLNLETGFHAQPPLDLGTLFGGGANRRVVGEFNGDGLSDLAVAVFDGPGVIKVILGNSNAVLSVSQVITPLNNGNAQGLTLADITGDGTVDLLADVVAGGLPKLVYYPGNGDGTFGGEQTLLDDFSGDVTVVDLNGDGLLDLLSRTTVRLAQSGGGYGAPRNYFMGSGSLPTIVADMNGDGRPDLVGADDSADAVEILLHR